MQKRGNEMHRDRDTRLRKIELIHKRTHAKVKAVRTLHENGPKLPSSRPFLGISALGTPRELPAVLTSGQRTKKEREQRIQALIQSAIRRWPNQRQTKGWNAWVVFVASRKDKLKTMRLCFLHLVLRGYSRAFKAWHDHCQESAWRRQLLQSTLAKMKASQLTRGFISWRMWWQAISRVHDRAYDRAYNALESARPQMVPGSVCSRMQSCLASTLGIHGSPHERIEEQR